MMNTHKSQALIIATVVMAICFGLAGGFLAFSRTAYNITQSTIDSDQAYYLAQSGIEIAKYKLEQNSANDFETYNGETLNLGNNSYITITVAAIDSEGKRKVTVTGRANDAYQKVSKTYKKTTVPKDALWYSWAKLGLISEDGVEMFQSFYLSNIGYSIAADTTEGTAWVAVYDGADKSSIKKFNQKGEEIFSILTPGLLSYSIGLNPIDRSCWVAEYGDRLRIFNLDGTERIFSPVSPDKDLIWLSMDSKTGSCWAYSFYAKLFWYNPDGESKLEISSSTLDSIVGITPQNIGGIAACPSDGSCWIWSHTALNRFKLDGTPVFTTSLAGGAYWKAGRADPRDSSLWIIDTDSNSLMKFKADGTRLFSISLPAKPRNLSEIGSDGSCWVGLDGPMLIKFSSEGNIVQQINKGIDNTNFSGLSRTSIQTPAVVECD